MFVFWSYSVRVLLLAVAFVCAPAFLVAPEAVAAGSADVAVLVSVDNASPNVGDTVMFTVTVVNGGPDTATNVSVRDELPSGLQFIASISSQGTYNSSSGVWTVGTVSVGGGGVQTLRLEGKVVSSSTQVDAASATADQSDPNPGNNSASAGETPQRANLGLAQRVDSPTPRAGQIVTFTVTLRDNGPDQATNVTVHDMLPPGLAFISAAPSQGTYSSGTGDWTVGTVSATTPQTLSLLARYNGPGRVVNTATVSHADQFDPDPTDNSSSLTVPRTPTQIVVASSANPSVSGQPLGFTATVSPAPDGGSVTLTVDGTPLAVSVPVNTTTGTATSPAISSLAVGSHQVVATYAGDANYLSSASPGLTQVVNVVPSGSTGPSGPTGGGGPPTVTISGLRISPSVFTSASHGPSAVAVARRKAGARVTYALNEPASVRFTVAQFRTARKDAHGRCPQQTRENRKPGACTRLVRLPGAFTLAARSGRDSFRFTGRVNGHPLPPGRYEIIATPSAGGHAGRPARTAFRIRTP